MKQLMERISVDPHVCHGQPCIKGTRIMVYLVLELLEAGLTPESIIKEYYSQIDRQDIEACLHYAAGLTIAKGCPTRSREEREGEAWADERQGNTSSI
ncbi:MAG: DUF433 domain-containing protein [Syntrophobacteraceae bacterium]